MRPYLAWEAAEAGPAVAALVEAAEHLATGASFPSMVVEAALLAEASAEELPLLGTAEVLAEHSEGEAGAAGHSVAVEERPSPFVEAAGAAEEVAKLGSVRPADSRTDRGWDILRTHRGGF